MIPLTSQPLWSITMAAVLCFWVYFSWHDYRTCTIRTCHIRLAFESLVALTSTQTLFAVLISGGYMPVPSEVFQLASSALGACGYYGIFRLLYLTGHLGGGDVRLAGVMGLVHGWYGIEHAGLALLWIVGVPAFWGMWLLVYRAVKSEVNEESTFPYGPGMCFGSAAALLAI